MPLQNRKDLLRQQIQALSAVQQELRHFYMTANDLDLSDQIRQRLNEVDEILYAKQAKLDALEASSKIPPVSNAEKETLTKLLKQLDAYVRSDQNMHMCITYLTQIADGISKA